MSDVWKRAEVDSPCVGLCVLHPQTRLCLGCHRSIDEISGWSRMSPDARRAVMADLPDRMPRPERRGGRAGRRAREG